MNLTIDEAIVSLKRLKNHLPELADTFAKEVAAAVVEFIIDDPDMPDDWQYSGNWMHRKAVLLGSEAPDLDDNGREIWYEAYDFPSQDPESRHGVHSIPQGPQSVGRRHKMMMTGALRNAITTFQAEKSDDGYTSYVGVDSTERSYHQFLPRDTPYSYSQEEVIQMLMNKPENPMGEDVFSPFRYDSLIGVCDAIIYDIEQSVRELL